MLDDVRVDRIVEALVERAEGRGGVDVQFHAELEPTVIRGEPDRVNRAVSNLLDNAVKWSPSGGTVDLWLRDGVLTVRDRGPGFASADLPHVFERFYRADDSRGRPGSGLGLAIVRQAAEAHGGNVEAANAPDGGGVIRVRSLRRR
jgi:two-component system sensor histidine kinase MprB